MKCARVMFSITFPNIICALNLVKMVYVSMTGRWRHKLFSLYFSFSLSSFLLLILFVSFYFKQMLCILAVKLVTKYHFVKFVFLFSFSFQMQTANDLVDFLFSILFGFPSIFYFYFHFVLSSFWFVILCLFIDNRGKRKTRYSFDSNRLTHRHPLNPIQTISLVDINSILNCLLFNKMVLLATCLSENFI